MTCKGILLDMDNTLYPYDPAHQRGMQAVFSLVTSRFGLGVSKVKMAWSAARHSIHVELQETAASHNRLLYIQRMFENLGINPLPHALATYGTYWDAFIDGLELDEGVSGFLARCKEKGIEICLITDLTAHVQYRKIEKLGLSGYVSHLVTSEEAGREKPHPYIFMLALLKMGLKIDEVCMIGDSYEKDAIGAARLGIRSYWLNREDQQMPATEFVTVVKNFDELAGML